MNCHSDIRKLLSAYCGDDLPVHEHAAVKTHLKECPSCREEIADLQTTLKMLRTTPEVEPPPWLTTRIMAHIREQQTEKRGWLERIFLPLHIKLPLEAIGLLVVCVTGYYLSQTVETELKTARIVQDSPAPEKAAADNSTASPRSESQQKTTAPSAPPATTAPPLIMGEQPRLERQATPTGQADAVRPAAAPAPPPAYAPAPGKEERSAPAKGAVAEPAMKTAPAADFADRSLDAAPEMKKKDARGMRRQDAESMAPAPAGRAGGESRVEYLPKISLHLIISDRDVATESVRSAAVRSGATIMAETPQAAKRLKIRIQSHRLPELIERLNRIGRLEERPQPYSDTRDLEVTLIW